MRGKTTKAEPPEKPNDRRSVVTESSGNVFADMGVDNSGELSLKAELAREINASVEERGLTQVQAASVLGLHQPQVSLLRRGRLDEFSLERLLRCLEALDVEIELRICRKPGHRAQAAAKRSRGKAAAQPLSR